MRHGSASRWWRDAVTIGLAGLALRLAIVAWAWKFPPVADGMFYQRIAERIAAGHGYTWLWPDGAVTFAAHYPVGYPAVLGGLYAVLGASPGVAMTFNAVLGALSVIAVHRLVARAGDRVPAALAAGLVAAHPGLVGYTPAIMTEGVTAALVACAVWGAAAARDAATDGGRRWLLSLGLTGLVLGAASMVRPQTVLLAPALAWIAWPSGASSRRLLASAAMVCATAALVCAPWTARNCSRMGSCAFVSVNAGHNLLIGADAASTGAWAPVQVPVACAEVWDEAEKDACFGREARRWIAAHPGTWLSLVPRKLAATFDYCGAAPWYLHASSSERFGDRAKSVLQIVETAFERLVLIGALVALVLGDVGGARRIQSRGRLRTPTGNWGSAVRLAVGVAAVVAAMTRSGWIAHLLLVGLALGPGGRGRAGLVDRAAGAIVGVTALTHAVFFGAGRYGLVVMPLCAALAAMALARPARPPDFDKASAERAS